MSRVLIAVTQCQKNRWRIPAHRAMLSGHGADVRFFFGQPGDGPAHEDEVQLPVRDLYQDVVPKAKAILRWGIENGYDFIFKMDDDTWLDVEKLLAQGFERHEWVGLMGDKGATGGKGHCTSGGVGIWLSRRAAQTYLDMATKWVTGKMLYFDDWSISWTLANCGFVPVNSDLLWNFDLGPADKSQLISWHGWTPDQNREEKRGWASDDK